MDTETREKYSCVSDLMVMPPEDIMLDITRAKITLEEVAQLVESSISKFNQHLDTHGNQAELDTSWVFPCCMLMVTNCNDIEQGFTRWGKLIANGDFDTLYGELADVFQMGMKVGMATMLELELYKAGNLKKGG